MSIKYVNYPNGYVNVKALMTSQLPRPKHRSKFISDGKELIPIITVEAPI